MTVWVCSNVQCRAVFDRDPEGHCPACKAPDGAGWSTSPREIATITGDACEPKPARAIGKPSYIGTPAVFDLELACKPLREAFGDYGPYLVGSALERPNWRDVDVRYVLPDEAFASLFPSASMHNAEWEFDPRWLLMATSIAAHLARLTSLPIDFQFQPATFANERHKKPRHALGLLFKNASGA